MGRVEEGIVRLDGRVERLDGRLGGVETRLGGPDGRVGSVQQQMAQFSLALVVTIVLGFAAIVVALLIGLG